MEYSCRFRLYLDEQPKEQIAQTLGCCRFAYNRFLAERRDAWNQRRQTMSYEDCSRELTALKRAPEHEWLRDVDAVALQQPLRDLDKAYGNFFRGIKAGRKVGYPRFKSKRDAKQTYRTQNVQSKDKKDDVRSNAIVLSDDSIRFPRLGTVKCRVSKQVRGRILSATITKTSSGKYFVSVNWTDAQIDTVPDTGTACGVDLGIKELAILSDGTKYPNQSILPSLKSVLSGFSVRSPESKRAAKTATRRGHVWQSSTRRPAISGRTLFTR